MIWTKLYYYCDSDFKAEPHTAPSVLTFNELEIIIEKEVIPKAQPKKRQSDTEKLKEYEQLAAEGKTGSLGNNKNDDNRDAINTQFCKLVLSNVGSISMSHV